MNTPVAGMVVDIEARIDKLEKGLAKANRSHSGFANDVERRAKRSADNLRKTYGDAGEGINATFLKLAKSGPAALAAIGASAAGAVAGLARVTSAIAETGAMALRAGVDAEAFQALGFAARQNRVGVDALTDGLKEMALRADEFIVTGKGSAAEAFRRLGFDATDLARRLEDPSEMFLEIVGRLESLDAAAQIRVADELFGGTGGEQFVQMLGRGEEELRQLMQRARDSGQVLDSDVIRKAEEIDRKFAELQTRFGNTFKSLVVNAADFAFNFDANVVARLDTTLAKIEAIERAGGSLGSIIDLGNIDLGALDAAATEAAETGAALDDLAAQARELGQLLGDASFDMGAAGLTDAALEADRLSVQLADLVGAWERNEISAADFQAAIAAVTGEADVAVSAVGAIDGLSMGGVIAQIQGVQGALAGLVQRAVQAAQAVASIPGTSAPAYSGRGGDPRQFGGSAADWQMGTASDLAPRNTDRPRPAPPMTSELFDPDLAKPSGGGGGGGARPSSRGGGGSSSRSSRAGRGGGGGGAARQSDYARDLERLREETAELRLQASALAVVSLAHRDLASAVDDAERSASLLAAAQKSGRADGPALRAEITQQVADYRKAADAADAARDRIDGIADARRNLESSAESAFVGLVKGTLSWKDALGQVLDTMLELAAKSVFQGFLGGMGGGGLFGGIGKIFGFSGGGYTGHGATHDPAGIVHRGEFVFSKAATEAIGIGNLDVLHAAARRGYSGGGVVGGRSSPKALLGLQRHATEAGQAITFAPVVNVHATGGTPEGNADLARRTAQETERVLRGLVGDEIRRLSRPGAALHGRA